MPNGFYLKKTNKLPIKYLFIRKVFSIMKTFTQIDISFHYAENSMTICVLPILSVIHRK